MKSGLILEPPSFKDYSHERVFGSSSSPEDVKPLGRSPEAGAVVYQGQKNDCVSCAFTWIKQWHEQDGSDLSHEWLAYVSGTKPEGATVRQVADAARTVGILPQADWKEGATMPMSAARAEASAHRIPGYLFVQDLSPSGLFRALKDGPVAVGVRDFRGVGPHMLAAYDVTADGKGLKCANWWKEDVQDLVEVPVSDVVTAVSVPNSPIPVPPGAARMPFWDVLLSKFSFHRLKAAVAAAVALLGGSGAMLFGGYNPVTDYDARTTSYITAGASSIPVNTTRDKAGNEISFANVGASRVYLTVEPGTSREEVFYCTGKTAGTAWTGCTGGLAFQGSSTQASTTLQYAHNAGSRVVMSDVSQFFNEYVAVDGSAQTVSTTLTFGTLPSATSSSAVPSSAGQLATKYYVDQVGAGGFTAANVSSSLGLIAYSGITNCSTSAACAGINVSATSSGLYFEPDGQLAAKLNSAGGLTVNGSGELLVDTADALSWSATQTFLGTSVPYPTSTSNAVPRNFVESAISAFNATGTAGTAISAGQALYVTTAGTLSLADADAAGTTYPFVGVAVSSATSGTQATYVKPGGIATGLSGLTAGSQYYISGTAGALSASPGAVPAKVGTALSATTMLLRDPSFYAATSSVYTLNFTSSPATTTYSLPFTPTKVTAMCPGSNTSQYGSHGMWSLDSAGRALSFSWGSGGSSPFGASTIDNGSAAGSLFRLCSWTDAAAASTALYFATTTGGFQLAPYGNSLTRGVYLLVEHEE